MGNTPTPEPQQSAPQVPIRVFVPELNGNVEFPAGTPGDTIAAAIRQAIAAQAAPPKPSRWAAARASAASAVDTALGLRPSPLPRALPGTGNMVTPATLPPVTGGAQAVGAAPLQLAEGVKDLWTGEGGRVEAAHNVLAGAGKIGSLFLPEALAAKPVEIGVGLAGGYDAGLASQGIAKKLGVGPAGQELAADIGGLIGGVGTGAAVGFNPAGAAAEAAARAPEEATAAAPKAVSERVPPAQPPVASQAASPIPHPPPSAQPSAQQPTAPLRAGRSVQVYNQGAASEVVVKHTADGRSYAIVKQPYLRSLTGVKNTVGAFIPAENVKAAMDWHGGTTADWMPNASKGFTQGFALLSRRFLRDRGTLREEAFVHPWQATLADSFKGANKAVLKADPTLVDHPAVQSVKELYAPTVRAETLPPLSVAETAAKIISGTYKDHDISIRDAADFLGRYFTAADRVQAGSVARLKGADTFARQIQDRYLKDQNEKAQPEALPVDTGNAGQHGPPVPPLESGRAPGTALAPTGKAALGAAFRAYTDALAREVNVNAATGGKAAADAVKAHMQLAGAIRQHLGQLAPEDRQAFLDGLSRMAGSRYMHAWLLDQLKRPEADIETLRARVAALPLPEDQKAAVQALFADEPVRTSRSGGLTAKSSVPDWYNWAKLQKVPGLPKSIAPSAEAFADARAKVEALTNPVVKANKLKILDSVQSRWEAAQAELRRRNTELPTIERPTMAQTRHLGEVQNMLDEGRWLYEQRMRPPDIYGTKILGALTNRNGTVANTSDIFSKAQQAELNRRAADITNPLYTPEGVAKAKAEYAAFRNGILRQYVAKQYPVAARRLQEAVRLLRTAENATGEKAQGPFQDLRDYHEGERAGAAAPPVAFALGKDRPTTPAQGIAAAWLKASQRITDVGKALSGEGGTPESRAYKLIQRFRLSQRDRNSAVSDTALHDAEKHYSSYTTDQFFDFARQNEGGQTFADQKDLDISRQINAELEVRQRALRKAGIMRAYIQNYMPHRYANMKIAMKTFMRRRTIPSWEEAREQGLLPETNNPVTLYLHTFHDIDRVLAYHQIQTDALKAGIAKWSRSSKRVPEGWVQVDNPLYPDKVAAYPKVLPDGTIRAKPLVWRLYAPPQVARYMNYLGQPGLEGGPFGRFFYDSVHGLNNAINAAQLGISTYHANFTIFNAAINRASLGMSEAANGTLQGLAAIMHGRVPEAVQAANRTLLGVSSILQSPAEPFRAMIQGSRMRYAWNHPTELPELQPFVQAYMEAGGRDRMDAEYRIGAITKLQNAAHAAAMGSPITGAARTAWWAPWAGLEYMAKPVMEYMVPLAKMSAFKDRAEVILRNARPTDSREFLKQQFAKAADDIDNRNGQVVYDNWFMNPKTKFRLFRWVRSSGWTGGDIRAGKDFLGDSLQALGSSLRLERPEITDRMTYPFAALGALLAYNGVATYMFTGEHPKGLDWIAFRNGQRNPDGTWQRMWPASYARDVVDWSTAPIRTASNKLSGIVQGAYSLLNNRDYRGVEYIDPQASLPTKVYQAARAVGTLFLPFSFRNWQQVSQGGTAGKVAIALGDTLAPRIVGESRTQRILYESGESRFGSEVRTPAEFANYQLREKLRNELTAKKISPRDLMAYRGQQGLTVAQLQNVYRESRLTPLQRSFSDAKWDDAVRAWEVAKPSERHELANEMIRKYFTQYRNSNQDERKTLREGLLPQIVAARKPLAP